MIQIGGYLNLDLASNYPVLSTNNYTIECPIFHSFSIVLWETNHGRGKEEEEEVPS